MKHPLPSRLSAFFLYLSLLFLLSDCRKYDLPKREFPTCETALSQVSHQATQLSVEFSVSSSNNATFDKIEWDFDDGKKESGPSLKITHKYAAKGTYTVKLTLTDKCGNQTSKEYPLTVSDAVVASMSNCQISAITNNSATFKFDLTNTGNTTVTEWGVYISETETVPGPPLVPQKGDGIPAAGARPEKLISNLKPGTKYYYQIYVTNVAGTATCGGFFTTYADPAVATLDVTGITDDEAMAHFRITSAGNPQPTEAGIYLSTNENPNLSNSTPVPAATFDLQGGIVDLKLRNLEFGKLYYCRAYVRNSVKEVVDPNVVKFVAADLSRNLVVYIPFDDNTVRNTATALSSAITTRSSGPITYEAGRKGNAANLHGASYVEMPDHPVLRGTQFSISLWIRTDAVVKWMQLFSKSGWDGSNEQYSCNIKQPLPTQTGGNTVVNVDYKMGSNCVPSAGWQNKSAPFNYLPQKWVNVVAIYDGNKSLIYIDGKFLNENQDPYLTKSVLDQCNAGALRFGAENNSPGKENGIRYFEGSIDEIRIYNIAVKPGHINALALPNP